MKLWKESEDHQDGLHCAHCGNHFVHVSKLPASVSAVVSDMRDRNENFTPVRMLYCEACPGITSVCLVERKGNCWIHLHAERWNS